MQLTMGALLEAAYARLLERHGFERIETGQLVDTYARSKFEDTRRKAQKFGARGTTLKNRDAEAWNVIGGRASWRRADRPATPAIGRPLHCSVVKRDV